MTSYDERPWRALYAKGEPIDLQPEHENALAMFQAATRRGPDRTLIRYFDAALTLAQVERMTDALAVALHDRGVRRGDRVAVYLQNVPQFVLAMIATWKCGAIMVSVNPMNREREVALLLNDSGAKVLVALESLYGDVAASVIADTPVQSVITTSELDFVDGDVPPLLAGVQRERHAGTADLLELVREWDGRSVDVPTLGPGDVALLTYTSGTTGPPKGAMNTHGNVVFTSQAYREWMRLQPDRDIVLGIAPLFHVTGLIAHVGVSLLTPIPLILFYRFDPATCLALCERYRPTFTAGSITAFIALTNHPDAETRDLSSLTKVFSGGAPIPPATASAFARTFGTTINNVYGLTETTSPSHAVPLGREAPVDEHTGAMSVGVPIYGTVVRVVGADGGDLPPGELGELVTRGPQVVAGYWNNPQETEATMPDGNLHTGDVGFMDEAGWFYVVDRMKDQINAGGYKVWPREVEDVLYEHPAVREAAVVGVPDPYRGETVKAFVSLKPGHAVDEPSLKAFCKDRMAAYKYPRQIAFVDELPKTATGKILRRELRQPPVEPPARPDPR
jgi:long-chain acyl-CoA synthetase